VVVVGVSIIVEGVDDVDEVDELEGADVEPTVGLALVEVAVELGLSLAHAAGTSNTALTSASTRRPRWPSRAPMLQRVHGRIPTWNSVPSRVARGHRPCPFPRSVAAVAVVRAADQELNRTRRGATLNEMEVVA
jgi:hypothetical protein